MVIGGTPIRACECAGIASLGDGHAQVSEPTEPPYRSSSRVLLSPRVPGRGMIPVPRCMRGCSREPLPQTTDRGSLSDRPARLAARPAERPSGARKRRAWAFRAHKKITGQRARGRPAPLPSAIPRAKSGCEADAAAFLLGNEADNGVRSTRRANVGNCWAHAFSPKTRSVEVAVGGMADVAAGAEPCRAGRHSADRLGAFGTARRDRAGAAGAHPARGRRAAGADRRPDAERAGRARRLRLGGRPRSPRCSRRPAPACAWCSAIWPAGRRRSRPCGPRPASSWRSRRCR